MREAILEKLAQHTDMTAKFDQETVNNMVSAAIIELNKNEIHWWSPS